MICIIVNSYLQRYVERIILTFPFSHRVYASCTWEEVISVLMEADAHYSVSQVEGLLDTVSMMYIYV